MSSVQFYGYQGSRCGYCSTPEKTNRTSRSYGMWAYRLTPHDYQDMIDKGWRRSGCYCYKPDMSETCCPMYTIRCHALDFQMSKSQKKIMKKMAKFLDADQSIEALEAGTSMEEQDQSNVTSENANVIAAKSQVLPVERDDESSATVTEKRKYLDNKTCTKKAKLFRIERKQKKLLAQGKSQTEIEDMMAVNKGKQVEPKSLDEFFNDLDNRKSKLEFERVASSEILKNKSLLQEIFSVYKKYQTVIHKDPPDEVNESSFVNFLVKSPITSDESYGSFHELYRVNGKLIASSVVDLLPKCISSVYFFYDPDYSFLSLGTFSALRDVYVVKKYYFNEEAKYRKHLKYYYMGFYIHSCQKMRYKAGIKPSKLLCPETYVWCDIDKCLPKLDESKYSRLNDDSNVVCKQSDEMDEDEFRLYNQERTNGSSDAIKCRVEHEDMPTLDECQLREHFNVKLYLPIPVYKNARGSRD